MTHSRPAAVHRLPLLLLLPLRFLSFPIPHHQRSETVVIWWQDFGNWCCCCYSRSRLRVTFQAWWKKKGLSRRDVDVLHTRVCRRCSRSLQRRQKRSKRTDIQWWGQTVTLHTQSFNSCTLARYYRCDFLFSTRCCSFASEIDVFSQNSNRQQT